MNYSKEELLNMCDSDGNLDLRETQITELPQNLTVGGWLDLSNTKITELPDGLSVGGNLYLSNTEITELPNGLSVGGNLYLSNTKITELPDGLSVGGWLYLSNTKITELPNGLSVNGGLDLSGTQITELPNGLSVNGGLDLRGTQITELPQNLTVCGGLELSGTQITELPNGLSVGGSLYLGNTEITELPDGLLIGKKIYGKSFNAKPENRLKDNTYYPERGIIYCDEILTSVTKRRKINGYYLYQGKDKNRNVVSTCDGKYFAHCKTFRDGVADILFKLSKERGAEQFKNLTLDSTVKTTDAISMYRIITGACKQGTESFVNSLCELKDEYTVKEMLEITDGQYGSDRFKKFFGVE